MRKLFQTHWVILASGLGLLAASPAYSENGMPSQSIPSQGLKQTPSTSPNGAVAQRPDVQANPGSAGASVTESSSEVQSARQATPVQGFNAEPQSGTQNSSASRGSLAEDTGPGSNAPGRIVFSDYAASAIGVALIAGGIFVFLIGGGLLLVNFGLMSKRSNDRTGERDPSDVPILEDTLWPEQAGASRRVFPAEEDETENDLVAPAVPFRRGDKIADQSGKKRDGSSEAA